VIEYESAIDDLIRCFIVNVCLWGHKQRRKVSHIDRCPVRGEGMSNNFILP
jgi:hypothetical protein